VGAGFIQRSFAGGEISVPLAARVDQPKARFGLKTCRNMMVMRNGALTNRQGTKYLHATKSNAAERLIPFVFDEDDSYAIQMGAGYFRFVRSAAQVTVGGPSAYSSTAYYEPGDIVKVGASPTLTHFYCKVANVGVATSDTDYWYALTMSNATDTPTTGGISILEVPNPFGSSALFDVRFVQSGDVITFAHPDYPPYELTRWGATDWTMLQAVFAPPIRAPVEVLAVKGDTGTYSYRYKVTAVRKDTYEESLCGCTARQEEGIASRGAASAADIRITTDAAHGIAVAEYVYVSEVNCLNGTPDEGFIAQLVGRVYDVSAAPSATTFDLDDTAGVTIPGSAGDYQIVVTALDSPAVFASVQSAGASAPVKILDTAHGLATGDEIYIIACANTLTMGQLEDDKLVREISGKTWRITKVDADNFTLDGSEGLTVAGLTDLWYAPPYYEITSAKPPKAPVPGDAVLQVQHTITWAAVRDAEEYWIYREKDGVYGYIGTARGTTFEDQGQEPDFTKVPPVYRNPFLASGNYPQAVGYVQQRLGFGGSDEKPQTVLLSRTGDFHNFTTRSPLEDDDALEFAVAGQRAFRIRHLADIERLMILTGGSELIARGDQDGVIRPTAINISAVGYVGSSDVQPILVGTSALVVQARGSQVYEFRATAEGYIARDLTAWAPHLVDGYSIVDWAWAQSPSSCAWAVRSDGVLLGLTYVPEQDIFAWHRHDTEGIGTGYFESVCVVPEGDEDVLYAVVKRTVSGGTVRYVERLAERNESLYSAGANQTTVVFLDSHKTYTASANGTATPSGLSHLEGKSVLCLRDGVVVNAQTVTGGAIAVTANWSTLVVGLQINADVETHAFDAEMRGDAVADRAQGIPRLTMLVNQSRAMYAGPTFETTDLVQFQMPKTVTSSTALHTGPAPVVIKGGWELGANICIRHNNPLPFTLLGLVLDVNVGGRG